MLCGVTHIQDSNTTYHNHCYLTRYVKVSHQLSFFFCCICSALGESEIKAENAQKDEFKWPWNKTVGVGFLYHFNRDANLLVQNSVSFIMK